MMSSEQVAGDAGGSYVFHNWIFTVVAGHRFWGVPATPGEAVRFVREPQNAADPNAIAVHDPAGRRLGFLSRELAADFAGLIDHGLVRLTGRLVAPGEPGYDEGRAAVNPPLVVGIHVDPARLEAFLERSA
jgi:hypothetical protein